MAAMFLRRLLDRRGRPISIVTTSNTLPSDLGRGRFAAEAFQREIGEMAARFEVLTIDGEDYRPKPLLERKAKLFKLVKRAWGGIDLPSKK